MPRPPREPAEHLSTRAYDDTLKKSLKFLNQGRDPEVPRRATVKNKYASKLVELEVWMQENLFLLRTRNMSAEHRRNESLLVYAAAATQLADIYPNMRRLSNMYVETIASFNQPIIQAPLSQMSQSLTELNFKIQEFTEQISKLDDEFAQKSAELDRIQREIGVKRSEVENLKLIAGEQQ
ncbi:Conserved_hypothetical protein [Hexamita inflata]|uniref:Uncharacterized protein n=1 Tax=Hexamita inflata TaxID=28002 RepID=A0AA86TTF1_9EUKA|nr:Conserved hypothetical protein [Hexamita inflata]